MLFRWEVRWVDDSPPLLIDTKASGSPVPVLTGWIEVCDHLGRIHTINGSHVRRIISTQLQEMSPSSRGADAGAV